MSKKNLLFNNYSKKAKQFRLTKSGNAVNCFHEINQGKLMNDVNIGEEEN